MTEKPRTWTLEPAGHVWPAFQSAANVKVIELEPVLDLLERTLETGEPPHDAEVEESVEALLKEHRP